MPVFVALVVSGAVEISVLVLVGQVIGVLPTVGLLAASAVIGMWLVRREGRRTMQEFNEAVRLRRPPTREISDSLLIAAGGLLILVPGLVSDVVGLSCLLPPTRALLRGGLQRAAERRSRTLQERMREAQAGAQDPRYRRSAASSDGDVIDGEVVSVSEDDDPADGSSGPSARPLPPQGAAGDEHPRARGSGTDGK